MFLPFVTRPTALSVIGDGAMVVVVGAVVFVVATLVVVPPAGMARNGPLIS
jgi:hypothetical protein